MVDHYLQTVPLKSDLTKPKPSADLLVLLTDAFGGRGGIAKFNRDLLTALCLHPGVSRVTALPRVIAEETGNLPAKLAFDVRAAQGKASFLYCLFRLIAGRKQFGAVLCAHIHLLPLAAIVARWYRAPLILNIHGIEAWKAPQVFGLSLSLRRVTAFVSVSEFTKLRFLEWAPLRGKQGYVVPNCISLSKFSPGPKPVRLLERYGLSGRRVIMTLARLSASERYKGIDEVLDVMPMLVEDMADLVYLIVGDGDDRSRMESKAAVLGITDNVVFAGYIAEEEKADHYRLADAFVMPGRGEGFGIVYLEALACGIPVVASKADASREVILEGIPGVTVNPDSPREIRSAIKEVLNRPRGLQGSLEYFSFEHFVEHWHTVLQSHVFRSKVAVPAGIPVLPN
jgi:phosphatidylinositol alpha-1,6-mannosyltransferase